MTIRSIGLMEFNSISKGIETSDIILKASNVNLLKSATTCPGKYIIIIEGETGDVDVSIKSGKDFGGKNVISASSIQNIDKQLVPAIIGTANLVKASAIGVIEFFCAISAIKAADIAVKTANINLIDVKLGYAIGGKGVVTFTGEVGDVRIAVENAVNSCESKSGIINFCVIPKPDDRVYDSLI